MIRPVSDRKLFLPFLTALIALTWLTCFLIPVTAGVADTKESISADAAELVEPAEDRPAILMPEHDGLELPDTLLDAGKALLTSLVHPKPSVHLLQPAIDRERERQLAAMRAAMHRFVEVVWGEPGKNRI